MGWNHQLGHCLVLGLFKEKLRSNSATLLYTFKSPDALAVQLGKFSWNGSWGCHKKNRSRAEKSIFSLFTLKSKHIWKWKVKHSRKNDLLIWAFYSLNHRTHWIMIVGRWRHCGRVGSMPLPLRLSQLFSTYFGVSDKVNNSPLLKLLVLRKVPVHRMMQPHLCWGQDFQRWGGLDFLCRQEETISKMSVS